MPFQASRQKGLALELPQARQEYYTRDAWSGGELIALNFEGVMRGVPLCRLAFNPVRYNPHRNQIKVYHRVRCRVEMNPDAGRQPIRIRPPSPEFQGLFKRVVMQGKREVKKALEAEHPMTLVILSDTLFRKTLQPLVRWKRTKGFKVVEAYTQDQAVGKTSSDIKSYLKSLYVHAPQEGLDPPSFLLIVGDVEQVPLSQSTGQITDLYYTTFDGPDDYIPDLFYGRISVATTGQLEAVLDKLIEYEQYAFPDPSFLGESVLIAGVDASFAPRHGNGQISYASQHYFNASFGLNAHSFLYPESDSSGSRILELISSGAGFVNYTGHGLHDQWINPAFHQNDIDGLKNKSKYPLIVGNGCETNVFTLGECFAEALIRAPEKGALAYIGCTNDSYWDEDYYWSVGVGPIVSDPLYEDSSPGFYDRVFHSHGEGVDLWSPSLGEMIFGGNMSVQESNSPRKKFYWEIYQLAGDPSLVPWFGVPVHRQVSHPSILAAGTKRLDIKCAPRDYAALSREGRLLDAAHASPEGWLTLELPDTLREGNLDLHVSGDRYIPYVGDLVLGTIEGGYLDLLSYKITNESRVKDGQISQAEHFALDLQLMNRGKTDLMADTLVLASLHPHVDVLDSLLVLKGLNAGDTLKLSGIFHIRSGKGLSDQEVVALQIHSSSDTSGLAFNLKEKVVAPLLVSRGITWDDRQLGNGNGKADPGEWLSCRWDILNTGHLASEHLSLREPEHPASMISLYPGELKSLSFPLRVEDDWTGLCSTGPLIAGDAFIVLRDSFYIFPGRHLEDFSHGTKDRYLFEHSLSSPWVVDSEQVHSPPFALRSGKPGDKEQSEIGVLLELPEKDSLSFSFRVSSEAAYDFLMFVVDSVLIRRWSGEQDWSSFTHVIDAGKHRVSWIYAKDESIAMGEDAAWIDDLVFPSRAFSKQDLSLKEMIHPVSGPWLSSGEQFQVVVKNSGSDTLDSFRAILVVEGKEVSSDSISMTLIPGQEIQLPLSGTADLSERQSYEVLVRVSHPRENFLGNNSLSAEIVHYDYPDLSLELEQMEEKEGEWVDLHVRLQNEGNTQIDSFCYELWINDSLLETACMFIGLLSGEEISTRIRLADKSKRVLPAGYFDFLLRSVATDSVDSNNVLQGRTYWQEQETSIPEIAKMVKLYPNPAGEGVYLQLPGSHVNQRIIHLRDHEGRKLATYVLPAGQDRLYIPLSDFKPGSYLLELENSRYSLPLIRAN
jgi:hypothetical protein